MSKKSSGQIERKRQAALGFSQAIQTLFPITFDAKNVVPLKIGIYHDLRAEFPEAKPRLVRQFLRNWTRQKAYKQAREAAEAGESPRYDLQGNEV